MKRILLVIGMLLLLPGCAGQPCQTCWWLCKPTCMSTCCKQLRCLVKKYHRVVRKYDQLTTVLLADAVWLAPAVTDAYSQLAHGRLPCEAIQEKIKEDAGNNAVGFYVLMTPLFDNGWFASATAPCSYWSFILRVNGVEYPATVVEETCLPSEYDCLLGMCTNRFRTVYYVGFDAHKDGRSLIANAHDFALIIRSCAYEASMRWNC